MNEKQRLDALVKEAANCLNSSEETFKKEYEYRRKMVDELADTIKHKLALPFRKIKFSNKINRLHFDQELANSLKRKFGEDAVSSNRYTNQNCLKTAPASSIRRLWNRDLAAVLNFRHILTSLREKGTRPDRFMPQKPGITLSDKNPQTSVISGPSVDISGANAAVVSPLQQSSRPLNSEETASTNMLVTKT
ncbi:hypothetical protein K7432_011095 [Basidiobolus ranarum]|uniref:Uncharacterized protein n=1 Tax=Basidiobolus ranarum TaxID=34480 RepID=A0ABR2VUJ6_9FUNG